MMKSNTSKFRHELKYIITKKQKDEIEKHLQMVMKIDRHAENGSYMIRSLYFDDLWESAYREKAAGTFLRKKYRIRCYNGADDIIKLECKKKEGQYIHKTAASLSKDEFYRIINGDVQEFATSENRLKQAFYVECKTNQLQPKVIVDYEREPYVFPFGDVRITFDRNVRVALSDYDIFRKDLPTIEILPDDRLIMEVKYTEYLPEVIRDLLPKDGTIQTAASKYVMCLEKQKEFCRR